MAGYSAPGVYRREIDLSDVLISGGISNGGIVIRAKKGPVRRPVVVTNDKEFIEIFGAPYFVSGLGKTDTTHGGVLVPEMGYGSYGAIEFLKESNTLYVVRAYDNNSDASTNKDKYSVVEITSEATYCSACVTSANGIAISVDVPEIFDTKSYISTYEQYYQTNTLKSKLLVGYVGPGEDGNDYAVVMETINPNCDWLYNYDNFPTELSATYASQAVSGSTSAVMNTVPGMWTTVSALSVPNAMKAVHTYFPIASEVVKLVVYKKPEGKEWNELYANKDDEIKKILRIQPLEVFYGSMVPMRDADRNELFIEKAINGVSKFIYVKAVDRLGTKTEATSASWNPGTTSVSSCTFNLPYGSDNGGDFIYNTNRLCKLRGGTFNKTHGLGGEDSDFWKYFENREEIQVQILINTSYNDFDKKAVAQLCNYRKDCIAANQVGNVKTLDYRDIINTEKYGYPAPSFMALYAGYSKVYDTYNDVYVYLPNAIFAAAIYARVDRIFNPWAAPAGVSRATLAVQDQNKVYNMEHIGKMYDKNINSVKLVQGAGFTLWGQKTSQLKTSALDRINVRRTVIYIENNIERALNQFVFENNTASTRLRIYSIVDKFLQGIVAAEGLYTYSVICDESNNTPTVIDSNQLNIDVYIQPVKTAEFIQFTTVVTRTGVSFSDVRLKYA